MNTKRTIDPGFVQFAQKRGLVMYFADGSCEDLIHTRYALDGWEAAKESIMVDATPSMSAGWLDPTVSLPPNDGTRFRAVVENSAVARSVVDVVADTHGQLFAAILDGHVWYTRQIEHADIMQWQPIPDVSKVAPTTLVIATQSIENVQHWNTSIPPLHVPVLVCGYYIDPVTKVRIHIDGVIVRWDDSQKAFFVLQSGVTTRFNVVKWARLGMHVPTDKPTFPPNTMAP